MSGNRLAQIWACIREGDTIRVSSFAAILNSHSRLQPLKQITINMESVPRLLLGLVSLNPGKFVGCLIFFALSLALTVGAPFIIKCIVGQLSDIDGQDAQSWASTVPTLIALIVGYKLGGSAISIICDYLYTSLGYEYFAYLYWHLLNNYGDIKQVQASGAGGTGQGGQARQSLGKLVNVIEYDCNLVANVVFSSLTSIFYSVEMVVLFGLLIQALLETTPYSVFVLIVAAYVVCQAAANLATFALNRNYVNQKDKRLAANIGENMQEGEQRQEGDEREEREGRMLRERAKQLQAIRGYLVMRMVSKCISLLFPILINVYVFLVAERSAIESNQYIILILTNLIRTPIGELMTAMNLNAEILNSCRRIIQLVNAEKDSSNGERSEDIVNSDMVSAHTVDLDVDMDRDRDSDSSGRGNAEDLLHKDGLVSQPQLTQSLLRQEREECSVVVNKEKGPVNLKHIWTAMASAVSLPYLISLTLLYFLVIASRYNSNLITRHMLTDDFDSLHYLGLTSQILSPIFFYFLLIIVLQKVSLSLFIRLRSQVNIQTLNRISGDIASVDRSVTINAFQIGFSFAIILSSYLYSIVSLGVGWLEVGLVVFLGGCIWACFMLNRFIMHSRREVTRRELEMKAGILKGVFQGRRIGEDEQLQGYWVRIFQCKEMGLLIENCYMVVVSLVMLLLSLGFILLSDWLVMESVTKSILLLACLSIDRDMLMLFYAMVRLELSLVSFERVLNVLSPA